MIIRFKELAQKNVPQHLEEQLDISDLVKNRKDIIHAGPLHADLTATPVSGAAKVEGSCSASIEYACSRCLKIYSDKLAFQFDEKFSPGEEPEELEDDDDTQYVNGEQFELTPYIEESVLLELPMAPVCSEQCKGLCPVCGNDRNDRDCGCNTDRVDPRLAALQNFFHNDNS